MAPPGVYGPLAVVVIWIVVGGDGNGETLMFVPQVFLFQGVRVVFPVAGDEDLAAVLGHDGVNPCLRGGGQDAQLRPVFNVLPPDGGVPGVGGVEGVVKAPQQDGALIVRLMGVDPEELLGQGIFGNAVVIEEPRLGGPADVEGGVDVGFAPLHDPAQLLPVVHLFKGQLLHGSPSDDHSVEFPML